MSSQTLPVIPSELPSGFCPDTYQALLNGFSAHQSVTIPDFAGLVMSDTAPTDQTVAWLQLDGLGRPVRLYKFAQGSWLSLHPIPPGMTQWWFDVLPDFTTFDGGDGSPLSSYTGPMWQQAKNSDGVVIAAKFPVTAGTLPSGAVLAQGATGGEEKHTLLQAELPVVSNPSNVQGVVDNPSTTLGAAVTSGGSIERLVATPLPGLGGSATPMNLLNPYVVGYLLQRTTRLFYAV